jgi:cell wall-associated NlpC family hydrolase
MAAIHAKRARTLVGVPFRPQGRERNGMDCVGLCLAVYRLPASFARADYRLRGDHRTEIEAALLSKFRQMKRGRGRPGDLLLMQPGANQLHLGILTADGFVHADAGLRWVVETPGTPQWPVIGVFRRGAR